MQVVAECTTGVIRDSGRGGVIPQLLPYQVAQPGGAVIEKEIIFVTPVLRSEVIEKKSLYLYFFLAVETQQLFGDRPVIHGIRIQEIVEITLVEVIQQFASYELDIEVGIMKVEYPIVIDDIGTCG
jgi:hypothetical protein